MKSEVVNGVLSFIVPGLGHALNGNVKKGVVLFILMLAVHFLVYFFMNSFLGSGVETLYHLYAGFDAYNESKD